MSNQHTGAPVLKGGTITVLSAAGPGVRRRRAETAAGPCAAQSSSRLPALGASSSSAALCAGATGRGRQWEEGMKGKSSASRVCLLLMLTLSVARLSG